jgi:hypothetical protein
MFDGWFLIFNVLKSEKYSELLAIMLYLCWCKQGERKLVVKPVHRNFQLLEKD